MQILRKVLFRSKLILLLTCGLVFLTAQNPKVEHYQIKAAYVFNFTQFIEWPASAFTQEEEPLVIGILGKDPFDSYLEQLVAGEKVIAHPILVKRFNSIAEVSSHILFINEEDPKVLNEILASLKGRSILTISDTPGFIQQGGMIRFITVNKKIQFQINPDALKEVDLTISSKVLRLAQIVIPEQKR